MKLKVLSMISGLALAAGFVYAQAPDFSKVQVKTTKVADNFYTLEGQGGMVGVLVGPDGVFMVDAQFAPMSEKLMAAIKQISDKPVRFSSQYPRARRSYRRRREFRPDGRYHHRPRAIAPAPDASESGCQRHSYPAQSAHRSPHDHL